jgi:hypothetical protein
MEQRYFSYAEHTGTASVPAELVHLMNKATASFTGEQHVVKDMGRLVWHYDCTGARSGTFKLGG